jgi:putative AdoMet-dependent methyltransferase
VFRNYETILETIAERAHGFVIEFGPGTGNLTSKLLDRGLEVIGIEPSENMRKIFRQKLPEAVVQKGNFLSFPTPDRQADTVVSSYAFHHLRDEDKEQAIRMYAKLLDENGMILFGDTMYQTEEERRNAYLRAKEQGHYRLANDLNTEFYPLIPDLEKMLNRHGFSASFEQMNDFAWIVEARKKEIPSN